VRGAVDFQNGRGPTRRREWGNLETFRLTPGFSPPVLVPKWETIEALTLVRKGNVPSVPGFPVSGFSAV
jgi:hypothetical protein